MSLQDPVEESRTEIKIGSRSFRVEDTKVGRDTDLILDENGSRKTVTVEQLLDAAGDNSDAVKNSLYTQVQRSPLEPKHEDFGVPSPDRRDLGDKAEFASKILEAEYFHDNYDSLEEIVDLDDGKKSRLLENVERDDFEQLIEGAKAEITEEDYLDGIAYLQKNGSEIVNSGDLYEWAESRNYIEKSLEPVSGYCGWDFQNSEYVMNE